MKTRGVICILLVLILLPAVSSSWLTDLFNGKITGNVIGDSDDTILKLSSSTNAHGELYNTGSYTEKILYSSKFGGGTTEFSGVDHPTCTSANAILYLSATTNAHAQFGEQGCAGTAETCESFNLDPAHCNMQDGCSFDYDLSICIGTATPCSETGLGIGDCGLQHGCYWNENSYTTPVCYGDLACSLKTGVEMCDTASGETCLVTLSYTTNAHLATCSADGSGGYDYKICCQSGAPVTCESYTNIEDCFANPDELCTWTPPGTNASTDIDCAGLTNPENCLIGGGCCEADEIWDEFEGKCAGGTTIFPCNTLWAPTIIGQTPNVTVANIIDDVISPDQPWTHSCMQVAQNKKGWWPTTAYPQNL